MPVQDELRRKHLKALINDPNATREEKEEAWRELNAETDQVVEHSNAAVTPRRPTAESVQGDEKLRIYFETPSAQRWLLETVDTWPRSAQQLFRDIVVGRVLGDYGTDYNFAGLVDRLSALYARTDSPALREEVLLALRFLKRSKITPADQKQAAEVFLANLPN